MHIWLHWLLSTGLYFALLMVILVAFQDYDGRTQFERGIKFNPKYIWMIGLIFF